MSRGDQAFKQGARAVKGAVKAGFEVHRVEIDAGGKIAVFVKRPNQQSAEQSVNEWDGVR